MFPYASPLVALRFAWACMKSSPTRQRMSAQIPTQTMTSSTIEIVDAMRYVRPGRRSSPPT